ncbi:MAG: serine/threonine-protein kinase [Planctomycetota bacterium]
MSEPGQPTSFDDLADQFAEAVRRGERPDVENWAEDHQEHAEAIRNLFPTILAMEQMKSSSTPVQARVSLSVGDRLGDFEILREIGRGGMGVVFEAHQDSLDRRVALKVLPGGEDSRRLQRFEREVRTAAKLHHTNIVPIFGVGEHDGWRYYVMPVIHGVSLDRIAARMTLDREAIEGVADWSPNQAADSVSEVVGSLYRVVDSGSASASGSSPSTGGEPGESAPATKKAPVRGTRQLFRSIAEVGRQAASALSYAHASGVLHRDIKPANLLLDTDGIVWITDFGLAIASGSEELTRTGDVLGTVQYLAPEQLEGRSDVRSDVFALGLTLYELCCGRPARQGSDRAQVLRDAATLRPERLRSRVAAIPRDLETVVHRACELDPRHRYPTAKDLEDDLERFLEGRPIAARRTTPGEELWRWCQRNRLVASLAAAAVIGVVGGGSAAAVGWYQASKSSAASEQRLRDAYAGFDNVAASLVGISRLGIGDAGTDEMDVGGTWFETSVEWNLSQVSDSERAVAEELLAYYESLSDEVEGGEDRELLARASRRRGDLLGFLRETEPAREAYESALEVYEEFETDEARLARAEIYFRLANLDLTAGIEAVATQSQSRSPGFRERERGRLSLHELARQGVDRESLDRAADAITSMQRELEPLETIDSRFQVARSEKIAATVSLLGGEEEAAQRHWDAAARQYSALSSERPEDSQIAVEAVESVLFLFGSPEKFKDGFADTPRDVLELGYEVLQTTVPSMLKPAISQAMWRAQLEASMRLAGVLHYARRQRDDLSFEAPFEIVVDRVIELGGTELFDARRSLVFAASVGALAQRASDEEIEVRVRRGLDEIVPAPDDEDFSPWAESRRELRAELENEFQRLRRAFREGPGRGPRRGGRRGGPR